MGSHTPHKSSYQEVYSSSLVQGNISVSWKTWKHYWFSWGSRPNVLCPLTDVIRGGWELSVCQLQMLSSGHDFTSDTGSSSLWSLWSHMVHNTCSGVPAPASSCCFERFSLPHPQGTWLLLSGCWIVVRVEVDVIVSMSFIETPKYEPSCLFSQLVHSIGILPPTPSLIVNWLARCCLFTWSWKVWEATHLAFRLQRHCLCIWFCVWVWHWLFSGLVSQMLLCKG